jgi:hypothetical protein
VLPPLLVVRASPRRLRGRVVGPLDPTPLCVADLPLHEVVVAAAVADPDVAAALAALRVGRLARLGRTEVGRPGGVARLRREG